VQTAIRREKLAKQWRKRTTFRAGRLSAPQLSASDPRAFRASLEDKSNMGSERSLEDRLPVASTLEETLVAEDFEGAQHSGYRKHGPSTSLM